MCCGRRKGGRPLGALTNQRRLERPWGPSGADQTDEQTPIHVTVQYSVFTAQSRTRSGKLQTLGDRGSATLRDLVEQSYFWLEQRSRLSAALCL